MFEDLGGIILVPFVAKQLGELSTFAILSLVGNVGMLVGTITYSVIKNENIWDELHDCTDGDSQDWGICNICCCVSVLTILCCPCFHCCLPCIIGSNASSMMGDEGEVQDTMGVGKLAFIL